MKEHLEHLNMRKNEEMAELYIEISLHQALGNERRQDRKPITTRSWWEAYHVQILEATIHWREAIFTL